MEYVDVELQLVEIIDHIKNRKYYHAVNDKHYDTMLCGEIEGYSWKWLGQVYINEEILNEQGFFYVDKH